MFWVFARWHLRYSSTLPRIPVRVRPAGPHEATGLVVRCFRVRCFSQKAPLLGATIYTTWRLALTLCSTGIACRNQLPSVCLYVTLGSTAVFSCLLLLLFVSPVAGGGDRIHIGPVGSCSSNRPRQGGAIPPRPRRPRNRSRRLRPPPGFPHARGFRNAGARRPTSRTPLEPHSRPKTIEAMGPVDETVASH